VAIGGAWALGTLDGSTTTVVERTTSQLSTAVASRTGLSVQELYERSAPAVVQVTTTLSEQRRALGSGFVFDRDGHIVTNFHVVEGADQIQVSFSNRETVEARLVGSDPATDLALLQVDLPAGSLKPLALGDSDDVKVGEPVVAIGNPFGLERTITAGIVSALQRAVTSPSGNAIDHVIQTDAPINHGNSGGPLLNSRGQVIGVNTQIETGGSGSGSVGIGFSVPSNTVKDVVAQILRTGRVDHAYLGISGQAVNSDVAETYNLPVGQGVLVESVTSGSGAGKAGLQGGETQVVVAGETYVLGGDIIVAFDGKQISSIEQLRDAIAGHKPGDKVSLVIYRDAKKTGVTVTLARQPPSPQG
jgi:S1-C subfamily serine protease